MKIKEQRISLEKGDTIILDMPDKTELHIGFGTLDGGQVPENKPWIISVSQRKTDERGFEINSNGTLKEYDLL